MSRFSFNIHYLSGKCLFYIYIIFFNSKGLESWFTTHFCCDLRNKRASPVAQRLKCLPPMRETGFDPWVGKIPWRRKWQPTPVYLPGESHGRRSLVGYNPRGHKRVRHDWATSLQETKNTDFCYITASCFNFSERFKVNQVRCTLQFNF